MTYLTLTLAAAALTITLAPSAMAYGSANAIEAPETVAPLNVAFGQHITKSADICALNLDPVLASVVGLARDGQTAEKIAVAMACQRK